MKAVIFDYNRTLFNPDENALFPSVIYVLDTLKKAGVAMFLIAKGNQERKDQIASLGIETYFQNIIVHDEKSLDDYAVCAEQCAPGTGTYAVGDRIKEEITHANRLGITTVWLKNGKFASEEPVSPIEQPSFIIKNLEELLPIILT